MKREELRCEAAFYGTSAPKEAKNSHTGLIVFLCLLVILLCSLQMLVLFLGVRLERKDGRWRLTVGSGEQSAEEDAGQTIRAAQDEPHGASADALSLSLCRGQAEACTPGEAYAQTSPAVVCLRAEWASGSADVTGVILSQDGYVLCSCEGLTQALLLRCTLADGTTLPAEYLGEDKLTGLCLLRVGGEGLPSVSFGSAEAAEVGQQVFAVSNPNGTLLQNVLQQGIVTAVGRDVQLGDATLTLLQSSAADTATALGCPIVDERGLVIGVTTALPGRRVEGVLAVAADDLQAVIDRILAANPAARLALGIDVGEIPAVLASYYRYPGGLWIRSITDRALEQAGLYPFDVIVQVAGVNVAGWQAYNEAVAAAGTEEPLELLIYRGGEYYRVWLTVTEQ